MTTGKVISVVQGLLAASLACRAAYVHELSITAFLTVIAAVSAVQALYMYPSEDDGNGVE